MGNAVQAAVAVFPISALAGYMGYAVVMFLLVALFWYWNRNFVYREDTVVLPGGGDEESSKVERWLAQNRSDEGRVGLGEQQPLLG